MKYSWDGEAMASASEYLRGEFEERAAHAGGRFGQRLETTHGARMLEGEQRLVNCENALENVMCWKRHRFQREFHDRCLASLAKLIVGDKDWEAVGERICRERNWDTDASICAAAAARRFGKSVAVADLAAVLAVFGPRKLRQGIFSPGRRQSRYLGEIIYSTLVESGFKHMITVYNQEEMWIVPDPNKPDDIRKIFYFPASSHVRIARHARARRRRSPQPRYVFSTPRARCISKSSRARIASQCVTRQWRPWMTPRTRRDFETHWKMQHSGARGVKTLCTTAMLSSRSSRGAMFL